MKKVNLNIQPHIKPKVTHFQTGARQKVARGQLFVWKAPGDNCLRPPVLNTTSELARASAD